jgi:hypothetical protein
LFVSLMELVETQLAQEAEPNVDKR